MQVECNNFDHFQLNLERFYYNLTQNHQIFSSDYFINYEINKKYFQKNWIEYSGLKEDFLEFDSTKVLEIIQSYIDLQEIMNHYDYICFEKDYNDLFINDFHCIFYEEYENSLEGQRWKKIFYIKNSLVVDVNILKSLEIYQSSKKWSDFIFPYVGKEYIDWVDLDLKDIYIFLFNIEPEIVPLSLLDMKNYLFINQTIGEQKYINPLLAKEVNGKVLYIGNNVLKHADKSVCYKPVCSQGKKFEQMELNEHLSVFMTRYINLFGLKSLEKNFYTELIVNIKKDIIAFLKKDRYGDWYHFLEMTSNLMNMLYKIKLVFKNTILLIKRDNLYNLQFSNYFDFIDIHKNIAIDLQITTAICFKNDINALLKKHNVQQYFIVSPTKIQDVTMPIQQEDKESQYVQYNDFFSWYIIDY